jgi:hypothetical protein
LLENEIQVGTKKNGLQPAPMLDLRIGVAYSTGQQWGGLKSEMQDLATPVRCEDDEKTPTYASRRARDAGHVEAARQEAAGSARR